MKALAPIPFRPGETQVTVPRDAEPRGVAMGGGGPVLLAEMNPITARSVGKVTWLIHGVIAGDASGSAPDKAEYVGCTSVDTGDGTLAVAAYVVKNPILMP